jgi:hypothetical protein
MASRLDHDFSRIFGGMPATPTQPATARIKVYPKPHESHRRTVTPQSMADWMRANPDANTREAMLVEFTEAELRDHFAEARHIYSRTLANA